MLNGLTSILQEVQKIDEVEKYEKNVQLYDQLSIERRKQKDTKNFSIFLKNPKFPIISNSFSEYKFDNKNVKCRIFFSKKIKEVNDFISFWEIKNNEV